MRRRVISAALSIAWLGLAALPAAAAEDPHIAVVEHDLEPVVQVKGRLVTRLTVAEALAANKVPAVSLAVIDQGRVVWAKAWGYADVAGKNEATTSTLFQAASMSKPVAASAALQLVQEGKLDLDADANTELKSWKIPPSPLTKSQAVTLRELLTHTAGLTVHGFPGYAFSHPMPTVVEVLEGRPPANTEAVVVDHAPGTVWSYSGGGITVVQLIMTDTTGQDFPTLMRRRVLVPLAMTASTYEQPRTAAWPQAATAYWSSGAPVPGRFHLYPEMAAAGLWTNPTELAKWVIALQHAYDGRSERLMRRATAQAMVTPGLGGWGLGIEVEGAGESLRFSHGGSNEGFKGQMIGYLSGGRGVVAMSNSDNGVAAIQPLIQAVARAYGWKGLEPMVLTPITLSRTDRDALTGRYGGGVLGIETSGDKLTLKLNGGEPSELVAAAADRLIDIDTGSALLVVRKEGAVSGLSFGGQIFALDRLH